MTTEEILAEAEDLLSQAYSVLMNYGVERSSNPDRVLMMDAIKLHFEMPRVNQAGDE